MAGRGRLHRAGLELSRRQPLEPHRRGVQLHHLVCGPYSILLYLFAGLRPHANLLDSFFLLFNVLYEWHLNYSGGFRASAV